MILDSVPPAPIHVITTSELDHPRTLSTLAADIRALYGEAPQLTFCFADDGETFHLYKGDLHASVTYSGVAWDTHDAVDAAVALAKHVPWLTAPDLLAFLLQIAIVESSEVLEDNPLDLDVIEARGDIWDWPDHYAFVE
jgi:hypothetical protein